jgi:hypothetical protein
MDDTKDFEKEMEEATEKGQKMFDDAFNVSIDHPS